MYPAYNPFAGIEVSQAAFTFIYRFMANKSAEYPEGILNKNVLKSFMAINGSESNLTWTKGYERIPDNVSHFPCAHYLIDYLTLSTVVQAQPRRRVLHPLLRGRHSLLRRDSARDSRRRLQHGT